MQLCAPEFPEDLAKKIKVETIVTGRTRSEILAEAVRFYFDNRDKKNDKKRQ